MAVEVKDKLVTVESAKVIHDSLNEKIEAHANSTANPHGVSPSQIGAVPTSRQINGKALSQNINLVPSDIGAAAEGHTHAVDEALSESSTNPVQNKIVSAAISQLSNENANLSDSVDNLRATVNNQRQVPICTSENNGQFLRVVSGVAIWSTVQNAEEVSV